MSGESPGPAAQIRLAGGSPVYVSPVTDLADYTLPPGTPGATMLAGPRASTFAPRPAASTAPVIPHPAMQGINTDPPPGVPVIQRMVDGSLSVAPLSSFGYTGDDAGPINAALLQSGTGATGQTNAGAPVAYATGGVVRLAPGVYNVQSPIVMPFPGGSLIGSGPLTVLNYSGSGNVVGPGLPSGCIQIANSLGPYTYTRIGTVLEGFIVDGTNAPAGAVGLYVTGAQGCRFNIACRNFTGAGSAGFWFSNDIPGTAVNQLTGLCQSENNTQAVVFDTTTSDQAIEQVYIEWEIYMPGTGQNGFVLLNGINVQSSKITAHLRSENASGYGITFSTGSFFSDTTFQFKNELTASGGSIEAGTVLFQTSPAGNCGFERCVGILFFSNNLNESNLGSGGYGEVQFFGSIPNDSTIQSAAYPPSGSGTYDQGTITQPAFPASGTGTPNSTLYPAYVTVNLGGGSLTQPTKIAGVLYGDLNQRAFYVPRGEEIFLYYTGATGPTWEWQPIG